MRREPFGFLRIGKNQRLSEGEKLLVEVTAEPRESKGPALRTLASSTGNVGLVQAGPSVREILERLAGSKEIRSGLEALEMSLHAEEEAKSTHVVRSEVGLDLSVQRTRAVIAVDIDYAPLPGRDSRKGRDAVNRHGIFEAARQIGLKHWAGTIVIDLAGVAFIADGILNVAKSAFGTFEDVSYGPLSRFGLLQLSLPWKYQPLDERFVAKPAKALAALRQLRRALLTDTATPFYELVCSPEQEKMLSPLVSQLGPRARLAPTGAPGQYIVREG